MAKIIGKKRHKKGGESVVSSYQITLPKVSTEKAGFTNGSEVNIEYKDDKIVITKK